MRRKKAKINLEKDPEPSKWLSGNGWVTTARWHWTGLHHADGVLSGGVDLLVGGGASDATLCVGAAVDLLRIPGAAADAGAVPGVASASHRHAVRARGG